jgi:hypothetical protein
MLEHTGGAEATSTGVGRKAVKKMSDQVDHAREQLDEAIGLFLKGQLVPALRLAGAADELLATALSDRGKQNFLEWKYEELEPFYTTLYRTPLSKEEFIEDENLALNAAKRMAPASYRFVIFDAEDTAYAMIVRACDNYDRLDLPRTARMLEFENYFYENVVGL